MPKVASRSCFPDLPSRQPVPLAQFTWYGNRCGECRTQIRDVQDGRPTRHQFGSNLSSASNTSFQLHQCCPRYQAQATGKRHTLTAQHRCIHQPQERHGLLPRSHQPQATSPCTIHAAGSHTTAKSHIIDCTQCAGPASGNHASSSRSSASLCISDPGWLRSCSKDHDSSSRSCLEPRHAHDRRSTSRCSQRLLPATPQRPDPTVVKRQSTGANRSCAISQMYVELSCLAQESAGALSQTLVYMAALISHTGPVGMVSVVIERTCVAFHSHDSRQDCR